MNSIGKYLPYTIKQSYYRSSKPFLMTSSMVTSFTMNLTAFQNVSLTLADPKYFITNGNPLAVPKLKIEMYAEFGFRPVYIKVTKVSMLNRKSAPCEESVKYSFEKCVKNWVSEVNKVQGALRS